MGATENFLAIARRAKGPLVALCDWDDVWHPRKLERIVPWFDDPDVMLVVHRSTVVDAKLQPVGRRYPDHRRTVVRRACEVDPWLAVPGMAMVFRTSVLEAVERHAIERPREAGGLPMDHDDWIYMVAGSLGRVVFLAEDLTLYRQHGGSYMGAPEGGQREHVDRALRLGSADFLRQAEMFRSRQALWSRVATDEAGDVRTKQAAARAAEWCRALAVLQTARAAVRDEAVGRTRRLRRLLRLLAAGGYRPRTRTGLGLRAMAADVLGLRSLTRPAELSDELADRIARQRTEGRSPEDIIADLTSEGVPPLYGRAWTQQMIRDAVYQSRRATEATALAAQNAGPASSKETR